MRGRRWLAGTVAVTASAVAAAYAWTSDGPQRPAGHRAACVRAYSAAGPWNTPIRRGAPSRPASLQGQLTSDPTQYTYPVYEVRGAPRVRVRITGRFSNVTGPRKLSVQRGGSVAVPMPPGAEPAEGSDRQLILLDSRTGDEWGFWRAWHTRGGWSAVNGYHYRTSWSGVPPHGFGSRGAGVPYLAGLIRPCEVERGAIRHALAFAYDAVSPAFVYPATKSDGKSAASDALPEGARLQLDPSLTRARLARLGCTDVCLTIARALQRYGMYLIDASGRPKIVAEYDGTAYWGGRLAEDTVSPIPLSRFRVVR
jgi:hypothetical protein